MCLQEYTNTLAHNQGIGNQTIAPEIFKNMFSCQAQQQVTTFPTPEIVQ